MQVRRCRNRELRIGGVNVLTLVPQIQSFAGCCWPVIRCIRWSKSELPP
jgi:hypothetical protein